jgi:polysaccharide pyruvyl transferase WcaK-like protein
VTGSPATRVRPVRVTAYGFLGMGNLGNEASLQAFLLQLRICSPDAEVRCLGTDPDRVRREHDLAGGRLMTRVPRRFAGSRLAKVAARAVDVPRTWHLVGRTDVVVVPGMGVLESGLGAANPFGLPFWMFLTAVMCRLRRRRFLLLSVGADEATNRVTGWFFGQILRRATYCSFRDELSRDAARDLSGARDPGPVYPDLAFQLPVPPGVGDPVPGRLVVGVMRFSASGGGPTPESYVDLWVSVITRLAESGRTVRLVIGDVADFPLAHDIVDRVRTRASVGPEVVCVSEAETQDAVMVEMSRAEVVVASRFHNVLGALRLGIPTVSLGYAEKNAVLLSTFGLEGFDQPIEHVDPELLLRQIEDVRGDRQDIEHRLEVVASLQAQLTDQLHRIEPLLR